MADLVIFGASDQGVCVLDLVVRAGLDRVVGFLDDGRPPGTDVSGVPVLGGLADAADLRRSGAFDRMIVAVGDNAARRGIVERLRTADADLAFATAVDPTAVVCRGAVVGEGAVVLAGAVVGPEARVGDHALLGVRSSLDHHGSLGDFASLAPAAATGGRVTIGTCTAIGIGATVNHGLTIGEHTVIGAGATVVESIGDRVVALGTPGRVVRVRAEGERYL
jgi:sugar O-acyltransferase (sialic acid O-acetyltransferase NeuD family)